MYVCKFAGGERLGLEGCPKTSPNGEIRQTGVANFWGIEREEGGKSAKWDKQL